MKAERILGALYGQALGDAMGMPSELWPRTRVKAHFGWIDRFLPGPAENNAACYFNQAEFTDDTSMALCLADALLECDGEIVPDVIGRNILAWAERLMPLIKTCSARPQNCAQSHSRRQTGRRTGE
jgi:ADP-ribosylglycohydrolase